MTTLEKKKTFFVSKFSHLSMLIDAQRPRINR